MRRVLVPAATAAGALVLAGGSGASAAMQRRGRDGSSLGREYAQFHVATLAQEGMLGAGGHKPGEHQGFSLCDPSGS